MSHYRAGRHFELVLGGRHHYEYDPRMSVSHFDMSTHRTGDMQAYRLKDFRRFFS